MITYNITKAVETLLLQLYFDSFEEIDGTRQQPDDLTFEDWAIKNDLARPVEPDTSIAKIGRGYHTWSQEELDQFEQQTNQGAPPDSYLSKDWPGRSTISVNGLPIKVGCNESGQDLFQLNQLFKDMMQTNPDLPEVKVPEYNEQVEIATMIQEHLLTISKEDCTAEEQSKSERHIFQNVVEIYCGEQVWDFINNQKVNQ